MSEEITRKEEIKSGSGTLYTKIITEVKSPNKEKRVLGMAGKDLFDAFLKLIGLSTIILAWLSYNNSREEKQKEEIEASKKEIKDSLKSIADSKFSILKSYRDSLQLHRINNRDDSDLNLRYLTFFANQEKDRLVLSQQSQLFQKEWLHELKKAEDERINDRERFFAIEQYTAYATISQIVSDLAYQLKTYPQIQDNKLVKQLSELSIKVKLFNDDETFQLLNSFRDVVDRIIAYQVLDTIDIPVVYCLDDIVTCLNRMKSSRNAQGIDQTDFGIRSAFETFSKYQNTFLEKITLAPEIYSTNLPFSKHFYHINTGLREIIHLLPNWHNNRDEVERILSVTVRITQILRQSISDNVEISKSDILEGKRVWIKELDPLVLQIQASMAKSNMFLKTKG